MFWLVYVKLLCFILNNGSESHPENITAFNTELKLPILRSFFIYISRVYKILSFYCKTKTLQLFYIPVLYLNTVLDLAVKYTNYKNWTLLFYVDFNFLNQKCKCFFYFPKQLMSHLYFLEIFFLKCMKYVPALWTYYADYGLILPPKSVIILWYLL